jgi:hypothetical protein
MTDAQTDREIKDGMRELQRQGDPLVAQYINNNFKVACIGWLWAIEAAYVRLLRLPPTHPLRFSVGGQRTLAGLREFLVAATGVDAETIQTGFEEKAASDNFKDAP